jgi:hypothetical protein
MMLLVWSIYLALLCTVQGAPSSFEPDSARPAAEPGYRVEKYPSSWSSLGTWIQLIPLSPNLLISEHVHGPKHFGTFWWCVLVLLRLRTARASHTIYLPTYLPTYLPIYLSMYLYIYMYRYRVVLNAFARNWLLGRPWAPLARILCDHSPVWVFGCACFRALFSCSFLSSFIFL